MNIKSNLNIRIFKKNDMNATSVTRMFDIRVVAAD